MYRTEGEICFQHLFPGFNYYNPGLFVAETVGMNHGPIWSYP
jgi:hypothetical protein